MAKDETESGAGRQIATLQRLSQQAVAFLLGVSARSVRDYPLARDEDGTYDARDVLQYARGRQARPELDDHQQERIEVICDRLLGHLEDAEAVGLARAIDALTEAHGDAVLLVLLDTLRGRIHTEAAWWQANCEWSPPTAAVVRAELERRHAEHEQFLAECRDLQFAVVCDRCGRLRRGRRWVKAGVPSGYSVEHGLCGACEDAAAKGTP